MCRLCCSGVRGREEGWERGNLKKRKKRGGGGQRRRSDLIASLPKGHPEFIRRPHRPEPKPTLEKHKESGSNQPELGSVLTRDELLRSDNSPPEESQRAGAAEPQRH